MLAFLLSFSIEALVVSIHDGDTFTVRIGAATEHVRIMSIDTPEMPPMSRCTTEQELAKAAAQALKTLMPKDTRVRLDQPGKRHRDRYGRLLANVILPSGVDAGAEMVRRGHARAWNGKRRPWCPIAATPASR